MCTGVCVYARAGVASVLVLVLVLVRSEVKTNKLELVYLRLDWPIGHQKRRKESADHR